MRIHVLRLTMLASAAAALEAAPLPAQAPEAVPEAFCIAGRPLPSCRYFLVATGGYHPRAGGSTFTREFEVDGRTVRVESPRLGDHYDLEIGVLANRGAGDALGGVVGVGLGQGTGLRLAVKGRYRRWMGRHAALEVGAGVLRARVEQGRMAGPTDHSYGYGMTGDVTAGLTDWISLSGRADLVWAEGESAHAWYGGVRLGSLPTLFTGILAAVVLTAVAGES